MLNWMDRMILAVNDYVPNLIVAPTEVPLRYTMISFGSIRQSVGLDLSRVEPQGFILVYCTAVNMDARSAHISDVPGWPSPMQHRVNHSLRHCCKMASGTPSWSQDRSVRQSWLPSGISAFLVFVSSTVCWSPVRLAKRKMDGLDDEQEDKSVETVCEDGFLNIFSLW